MTNELIADGIYRVSGMETSLKNGAWVSDAGTYLVTNQTKLADIPDARPGDIAFTAGYGHIWQLDVDSTTWVELPKTAAGTAATQAAASATAAAGSASAAATSASQAQTVAASIPADYTELSNSVVDLKSILTNTIKPTAYHDGYIGSDGTTVTNTTDYQYCDYIKLPFPTGTKISFNASMLSTRGIAFYDKFYQFLVAINGNNCSDYGYTANSIPQTVVLSVPANAVYIRFTYRSATSVDNFTVTGNQYGNITDRLNTLDSLLKQSPTLTWSNKIVNANTGAIVDNNSYRLSNTFTLYKGQTITFRANGNGNNVTSILSKWTSGGTYLGSAKTSTGNLYEDISYTATDTAEYLRITYYASSATPIPVITMLDTTEVMGITLGLDVTKTTYITVGSGKDYETLNAAIESIKNSSEFNRYVIKLYPGTYNTVVTADIDNSYVGLVIPDYVSIIGIGNRDSIIINGVCPEGYESYANNISTINFMANGRIENVTIKAKNLRYCNHDDNILFVPCKHEYVRCAFIMLSVDSGVSTAGSCVGIGAQKDKEIVFDNCTFVNENTTSSRACIIAHDYNGEVGLRMTMNDCKMTGGQYNIRIGNNVLNNPLPCYIVLNGNTFNKPLRVEAMGDVQTNIYNFRGTGNTAITLSLGGNLTDISSDYEIIAYGR